MMMSHCQSMAAADRNSRPTPEDESNEMEIEKSPSKSDVIKETDSTSSCIVSTTNQETQRQTRIEITLEKQRKLIEETFKDTTKKIHKVSICKDFLSSKDPQTISKNKHRFKHSILMDKTTSFSQDTGLWWLVYIEQEGMYCLLCKKHNNLNPNNRYFL